MVTSKELDVGAQVVIIKPTGMAIVRYCHQMGRIGYRVGCEFVGRLSELTS